MTKLQLLNVLFYIVCNLVFSQNKDSSIYFPQEQIVLKSCSNATDPNECLVTYFQKLVSRKLHEKKYLKLISKQKKDTVYVGARLLFNPEQTIDKESSRSWVSGKKLSAKLDKELDVIFLQPAIKKIINQKTPLESFHNFSFKYFIRKSGKEITLLYIPKEKKYTGGEILNAPIFPGCENLINKEARKCFNDQMQKHIAHHFRYPKKAQQMSIQGKVSIIFNINVDGTISNIRTKGPHKILEEEAVRIVKLLPKLKPGLVNGKSTPIPFSIPITFKLQ
ncbi:energy transducer TonB [uncultured Maribacter sp.]|uniref:energy transducer TonB n=1 Tax=uncultured Maribacter sp. TaxID=431308 RepID=UPI002612ED93|nr:energy transducer TonB [uncultured Maribacter sp.]